MPTVLRLNGYRFYFFAHEQNEPPHVHIDRGSGTMKLWLSDLRIASAANLKPAEIREALNIARMHHNILTQAWHEFEERKS